MKNLLYCVFREAEEKRGQEPFAVHGLPGGRACIPARGMISVCKYAHPTPFLLPAGVGGGAVRMLAEQGLAAAVSAVPERDAAPTIPRAMAFARVVEALHAAGTVLPMRYGCLLDAPEEVAELLRRRRGEFLASLDRLEGCAEMGIRVLLPEVATGPTKVPRLACPAVATVGEPTVALSCGSVGEGSGRGYLGSRRTHYAATDSRRQQAAATAESIRSAFSGLSVQFRWEPPALQAKRVLSLHFLIRRESVADFRRAFSQFQEQAPVASNGLPIAGDRAPIAGDRAPIAGDGRPQKVMLTGPWPPYHFAASGEPDCPQNSGLQVTGSGLQVPGSPAWHPEPGTRNHSSAPGTILHQTCGVASIEGPGGHRLSVRAAADGRKP